MGSVKWIKIVTNIFDNRKIRQIEKMPDADAILVIWLKILCLAGEINENGLMMLTKDIPYNDEMMANEFDRPVSTVRLALKIFSNFGMIETFDNIYCVSNWERYQNIEGLDKIREQTRERVAKHRENKKLLIGNVTSNVTVTHGNGTDIEEERDRDKDKRKEDTLSGKAEPRHYNDIVSYLNGKASTNYKPTSAKTKSLIDARLKEFTEEDFYTVIDKKVKEWIDTDMQKYLRPETLFGPKFESYLNQPTTASKMQEGDQSEEELLARYGVTR